MAIGAMISIGLLVGLTALSMIFKIAGKLRLGLPLLYFFAAFISTFFTDWTSKNEELVLLGLYILIALVFISWIYSLVKVIRNKLHERQMSNSMEDFVAWQLKKAREAGISINDVTFNSEGNMIYKATGEQVMF